MVGKCLCVFELKNKVATRSVEEEKETRATGFMFQGPPLGNTWVMLASKNTETNLVLAQRFNHELYQAQGWMESLRCFVEDSRYHVMCK